MEKPWSLENVKAKWNPEIRHHLPDVPIILVGNKIDLRTDADTIKWLSKYKERPVEPQEGRKMASKIGAHRYMECSALTGTGIKDTIDEAIIVGLGNNPSFTKLNAKRKKDKKCRVS